MILEGTALYYCVGTMVPDFTHWSDGSITVTSPDQLDIDNSVTSSSGSIENEYPESYTLTH